MAFLKSWVSSEEEGKGFNRIGIKTAASMGSIMQPELGEQGEDHIVHTGEITGGMGMGHARGILMKGDIPSVMQTGFDLPILAFYGQEAFSPRFGSG